MMKLECRMANPTVRIRSAGLQSFVIRPSDFTVPLCLSSYRASFVNSYSSVRVRPGAPFHGDHDVTAASRPVMAFVPARIRLVTPISKFESSQQRFQQFAGAVLRISGFNRGSIPHVG